MSDSDPSARLDRIDSALENQYGVNAILKTELESLKTTVAHQNGEIAQLRETVQSLLQVAQIQQQNLERLATEFQKHRQDGHGI